MNPNYTSLPASSPPIYCAARLPLAFFFGVSVMVRPGGDNVRCMLRWYNIYRTFSFRFWAQVLRLNTGFVVDRKGSFWILTGWQRLLQLLGLLGILQDKSVEVLLASDLELDDLTLVTGLSIALYAGSYISISPWPQDLPRFLIPALRFLVYHSIEKSRNLGIIGTYRKHPCVCKPQWTIRSVSLPPLR